MIQSTSVRRFRRLLPGGARGLALILAALIAFAAAPLVQARVLKLDRLEAKVVGRMPKEARLKYEEGLGSLDRILFDKALTDFQGAAELDQQNEHLRFLIVQLATYLGDTHWGSDSISYYGIAIDNMKLLAQSDQLNLREQQRALEAVDRLTALQKTVTERDERRHEWGFKIAKEYRKTIDTEQSTPGSKPNQSATAPGGLGLRPLGLGTNAPLTVGSGTAPGGLTAGSGSLGQAGAIPTTGAYVGANVR